MLEAFLSFPTNLRRRASLRGREYAWPLDDIPLVIEAARLANLVNIGGQLQFRIPNGGTCECYWVEVDTYKSVPKSLTWAERVELTAAAALDQYVALRTQYDFLAQGRLAFADALGACELSGHDANSAMCFVWYVEDEKHK